MHSAAIFGSESDWLDALFPDTSNQFNTPFIWDFSSDCEGDSKEEQVQDLNEDGEIDAYDEYWAENDREYIKAQTQNDLVVTICDYDSSGFLYCYDL